MKNTFTYNGSGLESHTAEEKIPNAVAASIVKEAMKIKYNSLEEVEAKVIKIIKRIISKKGLSISVDEFIAKNKGKVEKIREGWLVYYSDRYVRVSEKNINGGWEYLDLKEGLKVTLSNNSVKMDEKGDQFYTGSIENIQPCS